MMCESNVSHVPYIEIEWNNFEGNGSDRGLNEHKSNNLKVNMACSSIEFVNRR